MGATSRRRLSYSQVSQWTRCRRAWAFKYREELFPRFDRPSLDLGSAVHEGLAAGLQGFSYEEAINRWADEKYSLELLPEEQEVLQGLLTKAYGITAKSLAFIDLGHKWETVKHDGKPLIEHEFESELGVPGWDGFHGYVDWVARELATGQVWLIDFKVRDSMQPVEAEEFNLQMAIYQYLLGKLNIPAVGSIAWQIRNELPKSPKVNKDGTISRAACATDWDTYSAAVVAAGQDPEHYLEMKAKLETVEFFRLSRAYRGSNEVQNLWSDVVLPVAKDIGGGIYRNLNHVTCNGCSYKNLCLEELRGGDTDYIKRSSFQGPGVAQYFQAPELVD